jgi:SMC interacting uncharacterized protein involved in chromosome segregation
LFSFFFFFKNIKKLIQENKDLLNGKINEFNDEKRKYENMLNDVNSKFENLKEEFNNESLQNEKLFEENKVLF